MLVLRRAFWYLQGKVHALPIPKESAAQRCDNDVLSCIFAYLDRDNYDLRSASLTCRLWNPPAYQTLYRHVRFTVVEDNTASLPPTLLARTLSDSPFIRALVRTLHIDCADCMACQPGLYEWLPLLPRRSVMSLSLHVYCYDEDSSLPYDLTELLLRSPFLKDTHELMYDSRDEEGTAMLTRLLHGMPSAFYLELRLSYQATTSRVSYPSLHDLPCRIRYIIARLVTYTPFLHDILMSSNASLETLHLHFSDAYHSQPKITRCLTNAVSPFIHVFHLYTNSGYPPSVSLLPLIPRWWNELRELVYSSDMLHGNTFSNLPSSLEVLALGYPNHQVFPLLLVTQFLSGISRTHPYFQTLVVFNVNHSITHLTTLAEVCHHNAISFQVYSGSIDAIRRSRLPRLTNDADWKLDTMMVSVLNRLNCQIFNFCRRN